MIELTFKAESLTTLRGQLAKTLSELNCGVGNDEIPQPAATEKKKPGRKPAAVAAEAKDPVSETVEKMQDLTAIANKAKAAYEEVSPVSKVEMTKADVEKALRNLNEKKGLESAIAVLKLYGWQRISEVTPDKYNEFVGACFAAMV